ncbi:MAG: hypothetical protein ACRDYV_03930, partial [Acidimicrobiia bacterium]
MSDNGVQVNGNAHNGNGYNGNGRCTARIKVSVHADDPISEAGMASQLRRQPELQLIEGEDAAAGAAVAAVVTDDVDDDTARVIRALRRAGPKVVVVATHLDDSGLM